DPGDASDEVDPAEDNLDYRVRSEFWHRPALLWASAICDGPLAQRCRGGSALERPRLLRIAKRLRGRIIAADMLGVNGHRRPELAGQQDQPRGRVGKAVAAR